MELGASEHPRETPCLLPAMGSIRLKAGMPGRHVALIRAARLFPEHDRVTQRFPRKSTAERRVQKDQVHTGPANNVLSLSFKAQGVKGRAGGGEH